MPQRETQSLEEKGEAAGHTTSAARKQRKMDAGAQLTVSFESGVPGNGKMPLTRGVDLSILVKLSGNSWQ